MDLQQHSQYDLQDPRSYVDTNEFNLHDLNESIEKMRQELDEAQGALEDAEDIFDNGCVDDNVDGDGEDEESNAQVRDCKREVERLKAALVGYREQKRQIVADLSIAKAAGLWHCPDDIQCYM